MLTKCHINEAKIIYQPQRLVLERGTLAQMDLWTWIYGVMFSMVLCFVHGHDNGTLGCA